MQKKYISKRYIKGQNKKNRFDMRFLQTSSLIFTFAFAIVFTLSFIPQRTIVNNYFPPLKVYNIKPIEIVAEVTKYNPIPEQTDDTPDINAMGLKVRDGDVANNCLEFETQIEIDDRIYTIRDRMNPRYSCKYFDILSFDEKETKEFGRQILIIKILN